MRIELRGKQYDFDWRDFSPSLQHSAEQLFRMEHRRRRYGPRTRTELLIFTALEIGDAICWATKPGVFGHVYMRTPKPTFTDALQLAKAGDKRHFLNLCRCFHDLLSTAWGLDALNRLGRRDRQIALDRLRKAGVGLKKTQGERFFLIIYVPRYWSDNDRAGKMKELLNAIGGKLRSWYFVYSEASLRKRLKRYGIPLREFQKRRKTVAVFRAKQVFAPHPHN
jgi:hypothetical protein